MADRETIVAFITQYALTNGIMERDAEICGDNNMIYVAGDRPGSGQFFHGEGRNWHRNRDEAVKRAYEMRDNAIKSTERRVKRLKAMSFE